MLYWFTEGHVEEDTFLSVEGTLYKALLPKWLILKENLVPDAQNEISQAKYNGIRDFIKQISKVSPG